MVLSREATTQLRSESGLLAQDGALTDAVVKLILTGDEAAQLEVMIHVTNIDPATTHTIRLFLVPSGDTRDDKNAIAWGVTIPQIPLDFGPYHLAEGDEIWARVDNGQGGITNAVVTITGTEATLT